MYVLLIQKEQNINEEKNPGYRHTVHSFSSKSNLFLSKYSEEDILQHCFKITLDIINRANSLTHQKHNEKDQSFLNEIKLHQ